MFPFVRPPPTGNTAGSEHTLLEIGQMSPNIQPGHNVLYEMSLFHMPHTVCLLHRVQL